MNLPAPTPDFGWNYWRSRTIVAGVAESIAPDALDDASFRLLADNIPTLCWIANGDGYIVWYNRRWHEYCGTTPAQMEGWGWQSVHDPALLPEVMERWTGAIACGEPFEMTFPLRGADGVFRPFLTRIHPVRNPDGKVIRWCGVNTEISGQVAAEEALRVERDRSRNVLENMAEGFILLDRDFRVIDINSEGANRENLPQSAIVGRTYWEAWPGSEQSELGPLYKTAMAGQSRVVVEHARTLPDGSEAWIETRAFPSGNGLALFCRDVTGRRSSSAELAASEARFRTAINAVEGVLWTNSADGRMVGEQPAWAALSGQSYDEYQGYGWSAAVHPQDAQPTIDAWNIAVGERRTFVFEHRVRRHDGVWRTFAIRAVPTFDAAGEIEEWIGVHTDITDQRAAQARLHASEAQLRAVVAAAPVGLVFGDAPDGRITGGNARAEQILRHPVLLSPDVGHYNEWVSFHPDGRQVQGPEYPLARALAGEELPELEVLYRRGDGTDAYLRFVGAPVHGADGAVVSAVVASLDIDRERRAEMRQRLFLALSDRVRDLSDPHAIVASAVELLGRHLGVSRVGFGTVDPDAQTVTYQTDYVDGVRHLIGTFPADAFGAGNVAELRAGRTTAYADVMADPHTADAGFAAIETRAAMAVPLIRDGRLRATLYANHIAVREWTADEIDLVEQIAARTWDALERARAEAALRELNATLEQRVEERTAALMQAEDALRQSQKMEAVGQLTGGIAHDFNNLLTVVTGNVDMARRALANGDSARVERTLGNALKGAERAATLTSRLLAFSRRQPLDPKPTDIGRLLTGMSDLFARSLGETIRLETVVNAGLWRVEVDAPQLENAMLNLAVNARDAMGGSGRLTIEAANAWIDDAYSGGHPGVAVGQYVVVCVSDTGTGMRPEIIAKAFDPFFTTKEVGKGTGLGLSQVYGFVKQSGGHVKIYSEPGQGTSVKLYLPRLVGAVETVDAEGGSATPSGYKGETILVVEDDDDVRALTVATLFDLGYRVLEAADGPAALRVIERVRGTGGAISLLFTDVVMPEMSGKQLADAAQSILPGLSVLYTTGYARNAIVHGGRLDAGVELLPKPFTQAGLAAKVRDVLDKAAVSQRPV